jgi:hypothetical protein
MRAILGATAILLAATAHLCRAQEPFGGRLQVSLDPSEAEAVLAIVAKHRAGELVAESDWQRLFDTKPYRRLSRREASFHRAFTDSAFKAFVVSDSLGARAAALQQTLDAWEGGDLTAAAARAFAYLPPDAQIRAAVYPVIKPQTNSFVFEVQTAPTIFLYLNPSLTAAQFENTVAHELHHIGYASVESRADSAIASLPARAHAAAEWVGAFGEGFAMLAAAGGPDVHPHAESPPADRARWDRDMANFNQDLLHVQAFLLDIVHGKFATEQARDSVAFSFFGIQGPWYTVGWKMAVTVEKRFGRARLIECMLDPRQVLAYYNEAAAEQNAHGDHLALWSPELLEALGAGTGP